jgi:hypothetical protein
VIGEESALICSLTSGKVYGKLFCLSFDRQATTAFVSVR